MAPKVIDGVHSSQVPGSCQLGAFFPAPTCHQDFVSYAPTVLTSNLNLRMLFAGADTQMCHLSQTPSACKWSHQSDGLRGCFGVMPSLGPGKADPHMTCV